MEFRSNENIMSENSSINDDERALNEAEVGALKSQITELKHALSAVSAGEIDAIVDTSGDNTIVTQPGVEFAYRAMVESMNEGAAILIDETIVYCNQYFAKMLEMPLERVLGQNLMRFIPQREQENFYALLVSCKEQPLRTHTIFSDERGAELSLQISLNSLLIEEQLAYCMVVTDLSDEVVKQLQLAASVYKSTSEAMMVTDEQHLIISINPAFTRITGFEIDDVFGKNQNLLSDQASNAFEKIWSELETKDHWTGEIVQRKKNGEEFIAWLVINVIKDASDSYRYISLFSDVTVQKQLENSLRTLSQAVEQSASSIVITDPDANIVYANSTFSTHSGYSLQEVMGLNLRILQSGKTPSSVFEEMWAYLTAGQPWKGEWINCRKDGSEFIESVLISPIREADGKITHYLAIKDDITAKKQAEERIEYLAHFDNLTNLPNRVLLNDRFEKALEYAKRHREKVAIFYIDLDHFKMVNDSLGHNIGDQLLIEVAGRLISIMRAQDTVARIGGDEFVILSPTTDEQGAAHIAQKILTSIAQPVYINTHHIISTTSVGIAIYPNDGQDINTLSKHADDAMYQAKKSSRNTYQFFAPEMQVHSIRTLELSNALYMAIASEQLELHYQPQHCIKSGKLIGAEALIRWFHPELGNISPGEFIPIAEDNGHIIQIGEWVLNSALLQMKAWLAEGLEIPQVAVNLSAVQFRNPNLLSKIESILKTHNVSPKYLEIELTESVAMGNAKNSINFINNLNKMGIRVSIDDFGTGYSSLSYLKRFNVYKLKIDQSFVRDLTIDEDDKSIIASIINLAKSLGIRTIAEGVETAEQLEFLEENGCDDVQGYLFSKALPASDFTQYMLNLAKE